MADSRTSRSAVLFSVCMAHFLMPFMMSAVGIALPDIGQDFGASALQLGLVETVYVLSASIFLLAMGRFGDIHGRRRVFEIGVLIFTLFGGLISQAGSIEILIGLRFLQCMGGSMVMATTMAMVVSAYPPAERQGPWHQNRQRQRRHLLRPLLRRPAGRWVRLAFTLLSDDSPGDFDLDGGQAQTARQQGRGQG